MQNSFDKDLYDNVIRLHVIANSDSEDDQNAKMKIKDNVAAYIFSLTENAENAVQASQIIESNIGAIEECVKSTCLALGYDYETQVVFSKENYPVRYYDNFTFPAGNYKSLRIKLGSAKGKNWWCVLYPSLCIPGNDTAKSKLSNAGISDETATYITEDKYKIRFFLLDWIGL